MLIVKTLRSSTFKVALIWIAGFGALVIALFAFVYSSTTSYLLDGADRAMLLEHVWDLHFDPTTNIIDVYVGRVRRKVDDQQDYPLIHTVRGVGFCVRAPC